MWRSPRPRERRPRPVRRWRRCGSQRTPDHDVAEHLRRRAPDDIVVLDRAPDDVVTFTDADRAPYDVVPLAAARAPDDVAPLDDADRGAPHDMRRPLGNRRAPDDAVTLLHAAGPDDVGERQRRAPDD